jgi:conjugative transfer signal peptidase TraF
LRRQRRARRSARLRLVAAIAASALAGALALTLIWPPRPLLVWNASASAPIGLYRIDQAAPRVGDMVVAWAPGPARRLAARRHYLPANVPLVKQVAAARGARVCAAGPLVIINGHLAATRRARDRAGRPLPVWTGCRTLAASELFLLMARPDSFDGRYFGITRASALVGRARLIWRR